MNSTITFKAQVHFGHGRAGSKQIARESGGERPTAPAGRVPRLSRLMALAIRLEGLISTGQVRDYAELARLGHVSRARVTQIMNLLFLAPDIQESIVVLPKISA